jgi:hypothetical protein
VIDSIEKFLQIEINAPAVAFGDVLLRLCHRLMKGLSPFQICSLVGCSTASLASPTS